MILASRGYPESYQKGYPLAIPETVRDKVYVAGAKLQNGQHLTSGGRVVGCTAVADTLPEAIRDAYEIAGQVTFENAYCRRDIGARALQAAQEE